MIIAGPSREGEKTKTRPAVGFPRVKARETVETFLASPRSEKAFMRGITHSEPVAVYNSDVRPSLFFSFSPFLNGSMNAGISNAKSPLFQQFASSARRPPALLPQCRALSRRATRLRLIYNTHPSPSSTASDRCDGGARELRRTPSGRPCCW